LHLFEILFFLIFESLALRFPFFLVNLVCALCQICAKHFPLLLRTRIDAHLIASALLSGMKLKSFSQVADELGMSFSH
jgi:hypothetical protein